MSTHAARAEEAKNRRSLQGNTLFKDLGEPIQRLLLQISKDISDKELELFSKVSVRMLAKVYDMLSVEEDPEKILSWLRREARRAAGEDVDAEDKKKRKSRVATGASRDAVEFYKELERKNVELIESMKKAASEREEQRTKNAAERKKRQAAAKERAEEERKRAEELGIKINSVDQLKKKDLRDIVGTFERFSGKSSTADNSAANQDTEWWKQDEYRRDFEKLGKKGKLWNRVVEGGSQVATDGELAAREEWFKSQAWWKSDKYKRDWQASRDAEWWKEETYIKDWQDHGEKGTMWVAADEVSGFNRKGDRRPAAKVELERRVKWYKDNGPKGIVKMWCALTEGTADRCTLEEKRERDDYYKNGDWWKSEKSKRELKENAASCEAISFAGAAGADREWWKDEKYRKDFQKGGKLWKAFNEEAAVTGKDVAATTAEMAKREEWFSENWWKADKFKEDYLLNGEKGKLWKQKSEGDDKPARDSELKQRADWFESAKDREWWKDEEFLRDFQEHGLNGTHWTAAWKEAGVAGTGDKNKAPADELRAREDHYKANWWKASKYVKDFQQNGGSGTMWKAAHGEAHDDMDWWKQGEYQRKYAAAKKNSLDQFWKDPAAIDDYLKHGTSGKKWCAAHAAAASVGKAQEAKATPEEMAEREAFYKDNWWRAPQFAADFEANGANGKLWASSIPGKAVGQDGAVRVPAEEQRKRMAFYKPGGANKGYDAMLEGDAAAPMTGFADGNELKKREDALKKNWWKSPEVKEDFVKHGKKSKMYAAASAEAAALGLGDQDDFRATPAEIAEREAYFAKGQDDTEWFEQGSYRQEWAAAKDPTFWKNPEFVEDFLKNGTSGKKWCAATAAAGSCGRGDKMKATPEELKEREEWFAKNFWRAPQYQEDFEKHGEKGTLWTASQPDGKGEAATEAERKARMAFYKPKATWQLKDQPDEAAGALKHAGAVEADERREWYEKNWWKAPEVREDFEKHGRASKLLKAATQEAADMGLADDPMYQCSPAEAEARAQFFETAGDTQWWQQPSAVEDYVKYGKEGAVWQSRNLKESQQSLGLEAPATAEDLEKRQQWFEANFWKTPAAIEDFQKNGNKGAIWKKAGLEGDAEASADELERRRVWLAARETIGTDEVARRKQWFERQLNDEEKMMRRGWIVKSTEEAKVINADELADALAALNDGQKPSEEQLKAIEDAVMRRRSELGFTVTKNPGADARITQEEFVSAVADTHFYVEKTDEERLREEEEALEAMRQEEMAKEEEEAAFLAMEAEEERAKAGEDYVDEGAAEDEEAAFLDEMDEEAQMSKPNEDDVEFGAEDEEAWQDFLEKKDEAADLSPEEEAKLAAEEEARLAAEAANAEAEAAAWADEDFDGVEDGEGDPATLEEEDRDELQALVEEDAAEGWEGDEEEWAEEGDEGVAEEEVDEMAQEEKGQPLQWRLPLPEVTNPQFLKSYFTVIKYTPSHSFLGGKQKRVWVVDHFTRCFYNLEKSGKIKKEHAANKLLQLERNVSDPCRLRLMFFDASHSYELQFFSPQERERFYESASAIRPSIRVYAPDLTNQDQSVEACTTTIDGIGPNTVTVTCSNAQGKPVARELTGECKVNASKLLTEPLTIWTGTFNLTGHHPPRNSKELDQWMPKDKYDLYAVAVQEASYRKEESEWFEYVQNHLGKDYLTLASMSVWDTLLIVLSKKKHLLKITNVEGSTKATVHKQVCGTKGGIGISLRYLETSMAFVTCHLAARLERNAMRNTNVEEIVDGLQLAIRETDICNQFNHLFFFGDFNYRVALDAGAAQEMIDGKQYTELLDYDQMTTERRDEGVLHGFQEPPVTFAPTYRMQVGSDKYMAEKGNAPSYCARVLTRSMANTWVKCTGYRAFPSVTVSEHQPVNATFIVRCVRPTMSCFMKQQSPIPQFIFEELHFEESTGPIIKKPTITMFAQFAANSKPVDASAGNTASPSWAGAGLAKMECVTQAQEYLETCHILFVVREAAEKRDDKSHRGSAHLPLFGRVIGQQDTSQDFEADIMAHGKLIGKLTGKFRWEAAPLAA